MLESAAAPWLAQTLRSRLKTSEGVCTQQFVAFIGVSCVYYWTEGMATVASYYPGNAVLTCQDLCSFTFLSIK
jgi:hypothetical protein